MRCGGAIVRASFARRRRRAAVLVLQVPRRQSVRCTTETRSQISSSPFPALDYVNRAYTNPHAPQDADLRLAAEDLCARGVQRGL